MCQLIASGGESQIGGGRRRWIKSIPWHSISMNHSPCSPIAPPAHLHTGISAAADLKNSTMENSKKKVKVTGSIFEHFEPERVNILQTDSITVGP
jgi:hypothetical protein